MTQVMQEVLDLLALETIEAGLFRGPSRNIVGKNVFGGQVLGQALMAAARTVPEHAVHSLHGYFLRAGDKAVPIDYEVDRVRDGASFTMRRVVAVQHGKPIFHLSASFHRREGGVEHQRAMPDAPPPEGLRDESEGRRELRHLLPPVALAVVKGFVALVSHFGFAPFAWYRIAAGSAALVWLALR